MCGIVGYIGDREATPLLLEGLKRLEYRGYDSAGVAVMNGQGVETRKAAGKISRLEAALTAEPIAGDTGIAHTRWATHGAPNPCNAHPHSDCKGHIAVVHNGIIENSTTLRAHLTEIGHKFVSETDTEVIAHLIEEAFDGNLEDAVIEALWQIEGTYGIAVVSSEDKNKVVAARKGSPLLIGLGDKEYFVASDASAILAHTREVVYLDDGELAVLTRDGYRVIDLRAVHQDKKVSKIDWDLSQIERGLRDDLLDAVHREARVRLAHERDGARHVRCRHRRSVPIALPVPAGNRREDRHTGRRNVGLGVGADVRREVPGDGTAARK